MRLQLQKHLFRLAALSLLLSLSAMVAPAQTTSFTYQGRLSDGGTAANGTYDLRFALWDSNSGGTQIGEQTVPTVAVSAGIFTVTLDFGATAFPGANRFLEISARTGAASFTTLSPRQQITSTPYAIRSLNASSADAVTVSGVPGGSGNYIQNATASQTSANFNISGNGTAGGTLSAGTVNTMTQYNIGGSHALSIGNFSVFVGSPFAPVNKNIPNNTFVGYGAGFNNSAGESNSFFGSGAGQENTGGRNAFFGSLTGQFNTTGIFNSFFGMGAGRNSFNSTTGDANSFFGYFAGKGNLSGGNNTAIGREATFGSDNLTFATALGAFAQVDQSNSLVLGSIAGINGASTSVKVGIGTTTPEATLHVNGTAVLRPGGVQEISLGSPNGETGIGIKGVTNRADVRFDGQTLRLVTGPATGPPLSTNGIAIDMSGNVAIGQVSSSASSIHVCLDFLNRLAFCSSSLRYKDHVVPFRGGLELIRRLRPISFTWKNNGSPDLGLGAEDVAKVEPLLVTHNDKGEIQGVKYDQLNVVLINAIKQQQEQIETLRAQNAALNARLRSVERTVRKRVGSTRRRH